MLACPWFASWFLVTHGISWDTRAVHCRQRCWWYAVGSCFLLTGGVGARAAFLRLRALSLDGSFDDFLDFSLSMTVRYVQVEPQLKESLFKGLAACQVFYCQVSGATKVASRMACFPICPSVCLFLCLVFVFK